MRLELKSIHNNTHLILASITEDLDDCVSHPCLNDGICVDGVDAYTCTCTAGFLGIHCGSGKYQKSGFVHYDQYLLQNKL